MPAFEDVGGFGAVEVEYVLAETLFVGGWYVLLTGGLGCLKMGRELVPPFNSSSASFASVFLSDSPFKKDSNKRSLDDFGAGCLFDCS